jgi:acetoin utilization deacetylase AcuC-like enzyme
VPFRLPRFRSRLPVWYDEAYRLPLSHEPRAGIELRRADLVAWHLAQRRLLGAVALRRPERVAYRELVRVHTAAYLQSLSRAETLARIFAIDPAETPVDALMATVRLACGGTLAAARAALGRRGPALNLLGGFHHAFPDHGGGFCALADIPVAVASLRASGLRGRIAIIDLDAHPPDGLAACFAGDPDVWIGSISGVDWGPLENVDETVLPPGADDTVYLEALGRLLGRLPRPALAFVIAGGDVLAGDTFGRLGVSLGGARQRDVMVATALHGRPSVWLPGGGYHGDAWRVLAGSALVLAHRPRDEIAGPPDPLGEHVALVSARLDPVRLRAESERRDAEAIEVELGLRPRGADTRLLGYYSAEGVEYGLHEMGVLQHLERIGYRDVRVELAPAAVGGERLRILGHDDGHEQLLVEAVLEKRRLGPPIDGDVIWVHWLTLRDPRARFGPGHEALPGQEVPGLGLSREVAELFRQMATRLALAGVAFRPAWYHTAYVARHQARFADDARQGRFEALVRDLSELSLAQATRALAEGRVRVGNAPYAWEADDMVALAAPPPRDEAAIARVRDATRFTVVPG